MSDRSELTALQGYWAARERAKPEVTPEQIRLNQIATILERIEGNLLENGATEDEANTISERQRPRIEAMTDEELAWKVIE